MINSLHQWIRKEWKTLIILSLLVAAAFANSLPNGFISDDNGILTQVHAWNLQAAGAHPQVFLRSLLYQVLSSFGGLSPSVLRIPNILFHLFNTWVIFALLTRFSNNKTGMTTAALFAVHPIAVESVSWISGGGYAQYTLFLLSSLFAYIHKKKGLSLVLAVGALLTSDKAIVLPFVFALYEVAFGNMRKNWRGVLPFFVLSAVFVALLFVRVEGRLVNLHTTFYQGAPVIRNPLLYIPEALAQYGKLIFWPRELSLYHPDQVRTISTLVANSAIAIMYLGLTVVAFFRSRVLFFFLSFFLVSLSPTLLPVQVSWTVAERYAYLGSVGIIAATTYIVQKTINKKQFFLAILSVVAILLSTRTIIRNRDWHDEISFWSATAITAPNLPNVHSNLAVALGQKKDYEGAIREFQKTIILKPDWVDPYYNLALSFQKAGKFSEAIVWYQKTLTLNPNLWQPYRNLAEIAFAEKRYEEAIKYLNQAIEKNPTNANLFINLALVYQAKGDSQSARAAEVKAQALSN